MENDSVARTHATHCLGVFLVFEISFSLFVIRYRVISLVCLFDCVFKVHRWQYKITNQIWKCLSNANKTQVNTSVAKVLRYICIGFENSARFPLHIINVSCSSRTLWTASVRMARERNRDSYRYATFLRACVYGCARQCRWECWSSVSVTAFVWVRQRFVVETEHIYTGAMHAHEVFQWLIAQVECMDRVPPTIWSD